MSRTLRPFVAVLVAVSLLLGTSVLAQDTLAPDQYEPNNSRSQARYLGQFGNTPGQIVSGLHANFHDATDEGDWYKLVFTNGTVNTALEYWNSTLSQYSWGAYLLVFDVALSGTTSGANYTLSIDTAAPTGTVGPPLPISTSGNQNVRAQVKFIATAASSSAEEILLFVRRGEGVTVTEGYTLTFSRNGIPVSPSIAGISPTSGPPGTIVSITGDNLALGTLALGPVRFTLPITDQCLACYAFVTPTVVSPTLLTVPVPSGAATGPISVTASFGGSQVFSSQIFTVTGASGTAPPARKGNSLCCAMAANAALKGQLGRVVVSFPSGALPKATRVAVVKDGKDVKAGFGSQSWELLPGTYEIKISGKVVSNVAVQAGHDTSVKVGVLRVSASKQTKVEVLESGKTIASGHGNTLLGLPPGSYDLKVAGQSQTILITEGQITDF